MNNKDYREIHALVDKYYEGVATVAEVKRLQELFSLCDCDVLPDDLRTDCDFFRLQSRVAADVKLPEKNDAGEQERTRRFEAFVDSLPDESGAPVTGKRGAAGIWRRVAACAAVLAVLLAGGWLLRDLTAPSTPDVPETATILIAKVGTETEVIEVQAQTEVLKPEETERPSRPLAVSKSVKSSGGTGKQKPIVAAEPLTVEAVDVREITDPEEAGQLLTFVFGKIDSGISSASKISAEAHTALAAVRYDRDIITNKLNEILEP